MDFCAGEILLLEASVDDFGKEIYGKVLEVVYREPKLLCKRLLSQHDLSAPHSHYCLARSVE
jgi:hypothetical protein